MQNQTIFELYTDDNKSKYSSNPKDILKSEKKKKKKKNSTPSGLPQLRLMNLFRKLLTKKISNEHFNICEAEISLDEIIKYINSEIINLQLMMILRQNFVNTFQIN